MLFRSQNNTATPLYFLLVSSSDHITGATGKTPTVTILKSGASSFTTPAGAVTEIGNGLYQVAANATDANTLGPLMLHATATGCDPRNDEFEVLQDLTAAAVALSPSSTATTSITARTLVHGAMRLLGALAPGESATASETSDALFTLNQLIDAWGAERVLVPSTTRTTYSLTGGTASYTIGPGGTWNQAWPNWIAKAGLIYTASSVSYEFPLEPLTLDRYAGISYKSVQAPFPTSFYYDHAYSNGLGTVTLWPVPSGTQTVSIALYTSATLSQFASLDTAYAFAPGYARALRYNLAKELLAEYPAGLTAPKVEGIVRIAGESKLAIAKPNYRPRELTCEPALLQPRRSGSGHWSILSDAPNRA